MPLARLGDTLLFFVHIPKTGGASVDRYLGARGAVALWATGTRGWAKCSAQHMHAEIYAPLVPAALYDAGFTILRHPVARLVSEYRYRRARRRVDIGFDDWTVRALGKLARDPYALDNHLRPQHEFLRADLTLFRFEDGLDRVFDWIDARAGLPPAKRPWANRGRGPDVQPGPASLALIREVYAQDFALWEGL